MIKLFAYHSGNNGVSHYRCWQLMKHLPEGIKAKVLPKRLDRIQWDGLTGPCNVPGIGSHAEIIDEHDVIWSTFRGNMEECTRLKVTADLKPLVIDVDDDITNIDVNTPIKHLKSWATDQPDIWLDIPAGEEQSEFWAKEAAKSGSHIMQDSRSGKWGLHQSRRAPWKNAVDEIASAALVTVATPRLKQVYSRWNKNIVVIPNAVDFDWWPKKTVIDDGIIRIGLFGSNTHYEDWREIAETLVRILKEFPNVHLCINNWYIAKAKQGESMEEQEKTAQFPDYFETLGLLGHPQLEVHEPCEIEDWSSWLAQTGVDIGLAPLKATTFNRGKSNLKYLEFSALRVPGVYADLEVYNEDVKHGENGYLAGNPDEWYSAITRLIKDADSRRVMGNKAWQDVKTRYDQKNVSAKFGEAIKNLVEGMEYEKRLNRSGLVLAR